MGEERFDKVGGDFVARSYREYLSLDSITAARDLLSDLNGAHVHDEILFVVIHQNIELWFFQSLEEGREARRLIRDGQIAGACEGLERMSRIFAVLTITWDVLATLRPREFWRFREYFGSASGFQSAQFRELEFLIGLREDAERDLHIHSSELKDVEAHRRMRAELERPSLWDEVNLALDRCCFLLPPEITKRSWEQRYPYPTRPPPGHNPETDGEFVSVKGCPEVEKAWFRIYSDRKEHPDLYRLGEKLLDLSAAISSWRFKHIVTVERFIGGLPGSGGSSGVPYLLKTLEKRAFPELWSVRDSFKDWSKRYKNDKSEV